MKETTLSVSEFKAKCLRLFDEVAANGHTLIITKRGRPIARVESFARRPKTLRDSWKGKVKIVGDLVNFHDDWPEDA